MQELAAVSPRATVADDLVPLVKLLVRDDQESVRVFAVTQIARVAEPLTPAQASSGLLQLTKECASDRSWRVRQALSETFIQVRRPRGRHPARARQPA